AENVTLGSKSVTLRAKPSPWRAKAVTLEPRPGTESSHMVALTSASRFRSLGLRRRNRYLAEQPRAPERLRPLQDFDHLRHALPEPIGQLPRHPHGPRRRGDFAMARERIDEGVGLATGPAVFGAGLRKARVGRLVRHRAG